MPSKKSTLGCRTLHSQAREIVANVNEFMKSEAEVGKFLIDVKNIHELVSKATGVSKRSVIRIMKECKRICDNVNDSFSAPGKKHRLPKRITDIDDFDKCVTRRRVHNFYVQQKTVPAVKKLLTVLKESINFKGGQSSLNKILKNLRSRWIKTKTNRSILIKNLK